MPRAATLSDNWYEVDSLSFPPPLRPRPATSEEEEEELSEAEFAQEVVEVEKFWKDDPKFLRNIVTNLKSEHEKKSYKRLIRELIDRNPQKRDELQNLVVTVDMPSANHLNHHKELWSLLVIVPQIWVWQHYQPLIDLSTSFLFNILYVSTRKLVFLVITHTSA